MGVGQVRGQGMGEGISRAMRSAACPPACGLLLDLLQGLPTFCQASPLAAQAASGVHPKSHYQSACWRQSLPIESKACGRRNYKRSLLQTVKPADPDERRAPGAPFANRGSKRCRFVGLPGQAEQSPAQVQTFNSSTIESSHGDSCKFNDTTDRRLLLTMRAA